MTSTTESQNILDELAAIVGISNTGRFYSQIEACEEIEAILHTCDGDLPTSNAKASFPLNEPAEAELEFVCSESFLEIWYPAPYARRSGTATMVVPTALVLQLFASTLDPEDAEVERILAAAEYFETMAQAAPPPRPYEEQLAKMTARESAVAELLAIAAARPEFPMHNALGFLKYMTRLNKDVREGRDPHWNLAVGYPAHIQALGPPGVFIPVADVLALLAKHFEHKDPSEAARLRDIADTFYVHEVELDVELPAGDQFTLAVIRHLNPKEAHRLSLEDISEPLPGSVSLHPSTDSSSYSPDTNKHEYQLIFRRHEDGYETCLLIGPTWAYSARVLRED